MPQSFDAIVIGSGIGGLSAAAALASHGKRVLVLERLSNFGGAATVYRDGSLTMEASLHETDGDTVKNPHGPFARLGLDERSSPSKSISSTRCAAAHFPMPSAFRMG